MQQHTLVSLLLQVLAYLADHVLLEAIFVALLEPPPFLPQTGAQQGQHQTSCSLVSCVGDHSLKTGKEPLIVTLGNQQVDLIGSIGNLRASHCTVTSIEDPNIGGSECRALCELVEQVLQLKEKWSLHQLYLLYMALKCHLYHLASPLIDMQAPKPSLTASLTSYLTQKLYTAVIQSTGMMLRITQCFGRAVNKTWNEAQPIFKDYYSRRLTLSPHQLEKFVIRLSEKQFSEADHRWTSLLQNVESCLPKYQLHSKLYMLKALSGMKSKAALLEKLQESLLQEVSSLSFEEAALLLWCISKTPSSNKIEEATRIYRRLCDILNSYETQDGLTILIGKEQEGQLEQRVLSLKSTSICMVFSAMAHLGISEKTVIKHLLRSGVRPNAPAFSVNGLVTLLISLEKLGFRNRRDSMHIYSEIRKRYQQLEMGPLQTIVNLAWSIANLSLSKHFDEVEYDGSKKPEETVQKMRQTKADMKKFLLWLCETIILRDQALGREMAAKIVHYCAKAEAFDHGIWSKSLEVLCKSIEDCKIIDLVMALRAISSLQSDQRNSLKEHEEIISKRLWVLHSSISGKSLQILSHLYRINRIAPPPKICELLSTHSVNQQSSQQSRQRQQQ